MATDQDLVNAFYSCKDAHYMYVYVEIKNIQGPLHAIPSPRKPTVKRKVNSVKQIEYTPDASGKPNSNDSAEPSIDDDAVNSDSDSDDASLHIHSDRSCHSSVESSDSDYVVDEADDEIGEDASDFTEYSYSFENTCIGKGTKFPDAKTFKKVLRHHAIVNDFQFHTEKVDLDRVRVKCIAKGCNWRLHASKTRDKSAFQVIHLTSS